MWVPCRGVFTPSLVKLPWPSANVSVAAHDEVCGYGGVRVSEPSGATNVASTTPHVRCFPCAVSVVLRQRSIASAASNGSFESSWTPTSQPVGSSSTTPSQSSSMLFPGTSYAPGFEFGSQSLQSPPLGPLYEKPSPS
jgi:hypothetical protein